MAGEEYCISAGAFARMCQTTRDTLRYYEKQGILVPKKSEKNGYHYYSYAQLSSRIGVKGILKKLCYMAMVAVGAGVDYLLRGALVQAGIDLHIELFCGLLVAIWLIINELISVMENLAAIGVPGFPRLSKLLERLKNTVSKGDNADEK